LITARNVVLGPAWQQELERDTLDGSDRKLGHSKAADAPAVDAVSVRCGQPGSEHDGGVSDADSMGAAAGRIDAIHGGDKVVMRKQEHREGAGAEENNAVCRRRIVGADESGQDETRPGFGDGGS